MHGWSDAYGLRDFLISQQMNYPKPLYYSLMNLLGSHDKARVINRLCGAEPENRPRGERRFEPLTDAQYALGRERFVKAWRLVCALPGMPCLYYGDEAGAQGGDDPFCRGTFPWGREDRELTAEIARINHERLASRAARMGTLRLTASDADSITVTRRFEDEELTVTVRR